MKSIEAEYHKEYYRQNRHKWKAYQKRYYEKRKVQILDKRNTPEYKARLSDYLKQWRANNVEKRKLDMKKWAAKNKERIAQYRKQYAPKRRSIYQQRRLEILARKKKIAGMYRDRINRYNRERRKNDAQFSLAGRLRATLNRALRRQFVKKSKRTMELVGCSPNELKEHIQRLFTDGMTWDNRNLWHVDHIRPLDSFDLRNVEQQKEAMHFSNLQPLWSTDNHRKSNKWIATASSPEYPTHQSRH